MTKQILILKGSPRERGNSATLADRLAIGATEADIQFQFLSEAVAISLLGGFLGVLAGIATSSLFQATLQWDIKLTPQLLVFSGLFAAGIGIFFGYYPSRKASQLNPIEALRFE